MQIDFPNLTEHTIPMDSFSMNWRFADESYRKLPQLHLDQLMPLSVHASKFLWNYIVQSGLHKDTPFKKDFFKTIDKAKITGDNNVDIKKWLYQRSFPFDKLVYLSWQPNVAMIVPWKLLIKYFDDFYYSVSDDLTVIDESLNWALLFYHEDEIYFGTNETYEASNAFDEDSFPW